MTADSRPDTYEHIHNVQKFMLSAIAKLQHRALVHDQSKLVSPEVEYFDVATEKLAKMDYGSPEYKAALAELKPALDHHYAKNTHHPEHYPDGIRGMSLLDLLEMVCDWKAASMRHDTGNIMKSLTVNQERFGYSDELKGIMLNTIKELGLI